MSKQIKRFICSNCGAEASSWVGKCPTCEEWNTLEEELITQTTGQAVTTGTVLKAQSVAKAQSSNEKRIKLQLGEIDRVLGGGLVLGSAVILTGEPGIGKSTLLMQIAQAVANAQKSVLYVSGEESTHQVGLRAARLQTTSSNIKLTSSTSTEDIAATITNGTYQVVIVDSIQTVGLHSLHSSIGSVSQITSSAHLLIQAAKASDTCLILVGHVTKEGVIAGPKILEHIVDVVLQLEGDRHGGLKTLRSVKNRFGSTNEVVLFEMLENGLAPVNNPSKILLAERQVTDGSVVLATMEGSRPMLVEVQALVNKSAFGYPKRTASGIDINRLNVLIAMLERRTKLQLFDKDIYINIVGGMRIVEPAADLAVCMAVGSAAKGFQLKQNAVVFGEVGLSGEVRHVPFMEKRIEEAQKLGFEIAIGPMMLRGKKSPFLHSVRDVKSALNTFLEA